jgi:hypothetical protein
LSVTGLILLKLRSARRPGGMAASLGGRVVLPAAISISADAH